MADSVSFSGSPSSEVCICGIGGRSPVGLNALASSSAVRAGISALAAHPYFVDKAGRPMKLASDALLDPGADISLRLNTLLASSLGEALSDAVADAWRAASRRQCWVGLPEARPGLPDDCKSRAAECIASVCDLAPSTVHGLACGHAAGLMAIQAAANAIAQGLAEICLAAGVDSYQSPVTLEWLDDTGALMSSSNRNGFPPGEGAGTCVLASEDMARRFALPILARVLACSTVVEPHTATSTPVCVGNGLTAALRNAIVKLPAGSKGVSATYCDLNGERHRNEELSYSLLRVQKSFVDAHDFQTPADCWGDVGAASGPLFACLAVIAMQRGYAKGPTPILWSASTGGHRAAVLLDLSTSAMTVQPW
ncbi:beta-ketoacyl synthase N-terminal-like domain-containing protein [Caballeronia sp. LZ029]|uniref:beta-ketoacyl synthase N-terminal-like domain-containing protein n=1 Tax=Caballeronia sp. LZ029 TaxID=3038564 RepID=UPI00285AF925|nr:beta-ketoacyl synthase N-terminal-like domain-containing protein [Caballeronia sp. LZ029]MDR5744599.1 beta-ketoacyl synthase N-terminal-like domain-containing protein [Caballeronia sp. LZ029]